MRAPKRSSYNYLENQLLEEWVMRMENEFKITPEQIGSATVFHLEGHLDSRSASQLESEARQAYQSGARNMLLDFSKVSSITSAGLRVVHLIYKMLTPPEDTAALSRPPSGEPLKTPYLKLANLAPEVYYVFNVSGFLHNIAIYHDLESALKSFD
jgi:anti-anti-sigma factor